MERFWCNRLVWLAGLATLFATFEGSSSAQGSQNVRAPRPILSRSWGSDGEVPFTVQDGYLIVVEARIGGQRGLKFALDTGASHSVLRPDLVKGYEFEHRQVRIVNLDHVVTQELVEVRMLERPMRLVVDTGVRTILLYRDRMGERLPNVKIEQQIRGASLSGGASLEVVTLPRVLLNGTELERRAVLLRNSPAGFLPEIDGYLSLTALRARRFNFDFERNLLSWE